MNRGCVKSMDRQRVAVTGLLIVPLRIHKSDVHPNEPNSALDQPNLCYNAQTYFIALNWVFDSFSKFRGNGA